MGFVLQGLHGKRVHILYTALKCTSREFTDKYIQSWCSTEKNCVKMHAWAVGKKYQQLWRRKNIGQSCHLLGGLHWLLTEQNQIIQSVIPASVREHSLHLWTTACGKLPDNNGPSQGCV